jgi:hypothetical protein
MVGTEEVQAYDFHQGSTKFTLVDTPGFDDSRSSDEIIIGKILAWLHKSYRDNTQLNGLIFIHRISDPKMGGTALSNLRMFRKLCGPDCLKNVVLATTFWGSVNKETGEAREKELIENDKFWGRMVAKGSKVVRLDENRSSNLEVLQKIASSNGKVVVEAQKEMLAGKSAFETSAAQEVNRELIQWKLEKAQEITAEKRKQKIELERREAAARERLKRQREEAERRIREVQERAAEEDRQRAAEAERQRKYARARRQAELERQQKERQEQDLREYRMREAVREEREAHERRVRETERRYYENHSCARRSTRHGRCDRCGGRLHTTYSTYWRK